MAIRHYRKDPRTTAEKQADEDARRRFERGEFLAVDPSIERQALEYVQRRYEARRDIVATLGKEIGVRRKRPDLTRGWSIRHCTRPMLLFVQSLFRFIE